MAKAMDVVEKLKAMQLTNASKTLRDANRRRPITTCAGNTGVAFAPTTPSSASSVRSGGVPGVVGAFPDGQAALMLCAARLRHIGGSN